MKKLLVVVLAAALILGFATTASADVGEMGKLPNVTKIDSVFPDAKNETQQVKDDTAKMYALGVFEGLPNGTFAYDQTMTRAEMAKIVTYLTNAVASANALQTSSSSYPDVKTAVWYTGWINNVTTAGQMIGYPNGKFGPNDKVTVAELLTATLRTLGYTDQLAGNWPYDYVAQAAKLGLTKNVDTNDVKRIATRRDLVQVASNILDQSMVVWDSNLNRFAPYAASAYRVLDDEADYPFWSGWTDSVTWGFTNFMTVAPMDLLEYAFNARVLPGVLFYDNIDTVDDAIDAWHVDNFKDGEIALCPYVWDDEYEEFVEAGDHPVLASQYFISSDYTVFDLANMKADLIYTADGRGNDASGDVIYVDVKSSYSYTDDIAWNRVDYSLDIDGKTVRIASDFVDVNEVDVDSVDYAKVFYNDKGRAYAVTDLTEWDAADQGILDEYVSDDEVIELYTTSAAPGAETYDIEDEDLVVIKDKAFVRLADLKELDVLTYGIEDPVQWFNGQYILADELSSGKLTEGDDEVLTIGDVDYLYGLDVFGYNSQYNETGGANNDYNELLNIDDIDAALDGTVKYALARSGYATTFVIYDNGNATSDVYGVVTDIDVNNVSGKIKNVTILQKDGEEETYTLDKDLQSDLVLDEASGTIQLGSYIEAEVDGDTIIAYKDSIDSYQAPIMPGLEDDDDSNDYYTEADYDNGNLSIDRNGKRIKLDGSWYIIDSSTVIWNTIWDSVDRTSADFDSAEIIDNADLKEAPALECDGYVVAATKNGILKRLYVLDAAVYSKTKFDVISKVSKKSDGWNINLLLAGKTIYDEEGYFFGSDSDQFIPTSIAKNTFIAYSANKAGTVVYPRADRDTDVQDVNWIILNLEFRNIGYDNGYIKDGRPLEYTTSEGTDNGNSYWVTADADTQGLPGWGGQSTDVADYVTEVVAKSTTNGDTVLTLGTTETLYYLADDVVVIKVDDAGDMTKGSVSDIKASTTNQARFIMAISVDEDAPDYELGYVFVLDKDHPLVPSN
ncbi:MAG: S-layer homology domain-containing protein [Bacillota bacterium]|jgi:hypothetical protein